MAVLELPLCCVTEYYTQCSMHYDMRYCYGTGLLYSVTVLRTKPCRVLLLLCVYYAPCTMLPPCRALFQLLLVHRALVLLMVLPAPLAWPLAPLHGADVVHDDAHGP